MSFDESFKKGTEAMVQGKWAEAPVLFHNALECLEKRASESGPGARGRGKDLETIGMIHAKLGYCFRLSGKFEDSKKEYEQVKAIAEELKDDRLMSESLMGLGFVAWRADDHKGARQDFGRALVLAAKTHDKYVKGMSLMGIGNLALAIRDLGEGIKAYEEAMPNLEKVQEAKTDYARLLHNLAFLYYKKGDNAKALDLFKKALSISEPLGDVHTSGFTLMNMAQLYVKMDKLSDAEKAIEKGGRLLARSNDRIGLNLVHWVKGLLKAKTGANEEALELYRRACRGYEEIGMATQVLHLTVDFIPVLKTMGQVKEAREVLAKLRVHFTEKDIPALKQKVEEAEKLLAAK
jgi:tetratricopeptide (TPR) repeat protein